MHVGKMIPDREGLQVFDVHEEKLTAKHGSWDLHDACTGEIIMHGGNAGIDNGRGMAGDLTGKDGYEFWSSDERNPRNAISGNTVISKNPTVNYRIYWTVPTAMTKRPAYGTSRRRPILLSRNGVGAVSLTSFPSTAAHIIMPSQPIILSQRPVCRPTFSVIGVRN